MHSGQTKPNTPIKTIYALAHHRLKIWQPAVARAPLYLSIKKEERETEQLRSPSRLIFRKLVSAHHPLDLCFTTVPRPTFALQHLLFGVHQLHIGRDFRILIPTCSSSCSNLIGQRSDPRGRHTTISLTSYPKLPLRFAYDVH